MRTRGSALLAAITVSVLGLSALTGCQFDDEKADPGAGSVRTAASEGSPAANKPTSAASPRPSVTSVPATAKPTGRPSTTVADKRLVSTTRAAGLARLTGAGAPTDVPVDPGEVTPGVNDVLVASFGASAAGPRTVLFVGVDGLTGIDGKRLEHMTRGMVEYVNGGGGSVPESVTMKGYDPGPQGGTLECMPGDDARPAAICGWADRYTTAVAFFENLSADQAAVRFKAMRADLEK
ncbi:hypothetical protein [Embleya sp. NBC_00896]|uniref:hypothetical protein n=1 Tax=Embleya sp. NBC_00896 TaxID=2975961 RepID=UPI00386A7073|nr:hypothetical protein OG928_22730 [Embleya sp. NBC_00896]